jgi:hypothetical protein
MKRTDNLKLTTHTITCRQASQLGAQRGNLKNHSFKSTILKLGSSQLQVLMPAAFKNITENTEWQKKNRFCNSVFRHSCPVTDFRT